MTRFLFLDDMNINSNQQPYVYPGNAMYAQNPMYMQQNIAQNPVNPYPHRVVLPTVSMVQNGVENPPVQTNVPQNPVQQFNPIIYPQNQPLIPNEYEIIQAVIRQFKDSPIFASRTQEEIYEIAKQYVYSNAAFFTRMMTPGPQAPPPKPVQKPAPKPVPQIIPKTIVKTEPVEPRKKKVPIVKVMVEPKKLIKSFVVNLNGYDTDHSEDSTDEEIFL